MSRLIASLVALTVAAPAALGDVAIPAGAELVRSAPCCCFKQTDDESSAEISRACCCELRSPKRVDPAPPMLSAPEGVDVPPAAFAGLAPRPTADVAALSAPRSSNARAPPPGRTLLAQHTSLLL